VTDGTAAGTSELTVAGANSNGLFYGGGSPQFAVLGGKALFAGVDASDHVNLWVTDGTSAGTRELIAAGANPAGLLVDGPSNQFGLLDPAFTVVGSRVVFDGADASGRNNLWVTDGTPAGTSELTVVGANSRGLFAGGGAATYISAFGTKALFKGADASGRLGLWVTDGTSAGTSELNVVGANSRGLFYTGAVNFFPDLTVLGGKALFAGFDATGHVNLWVTDGTSVGTSEVAASGAATSGLTPSDITILVTATSPPPSPDLPWQSDGTSIFLQDDTGPAAIWTLSGTSFVGGGSLPNPGASWHAKAPGDFNGDGQPDILWQNDSGAVAVWLLNGTAVIGGGSLGNPGPSWQVASVGDFNGDGRSDILWQDSSGAVAIWELNGASIIGGGSLGNPGPSWHAVGSGDFNADGKSDILWQNDSGQVAIWEMNGTSIIGGGNVANPGSSWHALGTGDFNGDGRSDILLQNDSGQVAIWEMNGSSLIGGGNIANPGASWHAMGVGDYRLQQRRQIRHSLTEQQRRRGDLGDEWRQHHRRRPHRQPRPYVAHLTGMTQGIDGI
jgi:ELWxxDGT repeat protein